MNKEYPGEGRETGDKWKIEIPPKTSQETLFLNSYGECPLLIYRFSVMTILQLYK